MEITLFGTFWIVVGIAALCSRNGTGLLSLLAYSSIFQASMVMGISVAGEIEPVLPYYWIAILISTRTVYDFVRYRSVMIPPQVRLGLFILLAFATWASITTILAPLVFNGIPVYDPHKSIDEQYYNMGTLNFKLSMLGQLGYVWLNVIVIIFVARATVHMKIARHFVRAFIYAGAIAALLALWQWASWKYGLPYPYSQLNNAAGWSQGYLQFLSGVKRINGSFTEPSTLAAFMLGFFGFVLAIWWDQPRWRTSVLLALAMTALVMSTSTTAYIGLAIQLVLWLLYVTIVKKSINKRTIMYVSIISILIFLLMPIIINNTVVERIINNAIIYKSSSSSFVHRTAADLRALELLVETGGIGVGLGGNRPSSFLPSLLSNVGIVGVAIFIAFILNIILLSVQLYKRESPIVIAIVWGMIGHLIAKQISQPDLSQPSLWVWIAMLIAVAACRGEGRLCTLVQGRDQYTGS